MDTRFVVEQMAGVTVVFASAALAAWTLRKHSAASRHMIWWLAATAALLVPPASILKPAGAPTVIVAPLQSDVVVVSDKPSPQRKWTSAEVLAAAWLAGFTVMFGRLAVGVAMSSRRRRSATPSRIASLRPNVDIRFSDKITVPETFGVFHPLILLPVEASEWTAERLRVVLAHEFVHIERRDWLTQLVAQFTACVYWFHPLAWFALKQLRKERELACDDGVLRLGYRNSEYAEHLVEVARSIRTNPEALSPSVPMACRSQLETRVRAILNPTKNRGNVTMMMKFSATACTALAIVLFSSVNGSAASTSVTGTISDPSGGRVPNAVVLLIPSVRGEKQIATASNASGEWEVRTLPAGDYRMEIKVPGFRAHQQQITVAADRTLRFDVQMQLGSIQETLTVQGETSYVPQRATGTPQRIRVGGNVQAAKVVKMVRPEYPPQVKEAGISGTVVLQAVISREGDVLNIQVLSPEVDRDLITAATDAVMQWKYEPTLLNGAPVEVVTQINVNFTLARRE